jgi:DNA repair protein RadC
MDHLMPEMTGLEVIQRMRKQGMDHKVIIYSGFKLDQHEPDFPGVRFLKKPFGTTELSQQIRDVLGPEQAVLYQTHMNRVRVHMQKTPSPPHMGVISDAGTVYRLCRNMADEPREVLVGLFLDNENKLIACEQLSTGTTNESRVYPREVVRYAVATNATAVILVHNHPSGNLEPSDVDLGMTMDVIRACNLIGVELHEHFIITQNGYTSIISDGYMDSAEGDEDYDEDEEDENY